MPRLKKINLSHKFSRSQLLVFAIFFAAVGGVLLYKSFALNPNLPGDVNNDNKVDVTDLSLLLSHYGQNYQQGDFSSDGTINILDLSILLSNFNKTYVPPPNPPPPSNPPPPPPPPSGGGGTLNLTNQKFNCDSPVNYDLVKVTISQTTSRMDGAALGDGCTGRIGRLEIDTWSADGIHVGAFAHDLVVEGGYVHSHGVCSTCGAVHVDGVQVLGGQRITFKNLDINYPTATNSGMYINCGNQCQDLPTDVVCDGCTMKRSPEDNRVLRIGYSLRSGARNSTIYWCGHAAGCGAGEAIWYGMDPGYTPSNPVEQNNTFILN